MPPYGSNPYQDVRSGSASKAEFFPRFGAFFIDAIIGGLFSLPGNLIAQAGAEALGLLLSLAGSIAFIVIYCKQVSAGQSWGQKATGVRVVDTNGNRLTPGKVFVRQLAKIISAIPCYLGFLWMLWDGDKNTWHDKIVGTSVVKA